MIRLSLGVDDFAQILDGKMGHSCADKTRRLCDLAKELKLSFLSRPRGFGKTLLLSSIERLFKDRSDLLKGLWIDGSRLEAVSGHKAGRGPRGQGSPRGERSRGCRPYLPDREKRGP